MAETGMAEFGPKHQYGVLTVRDLSHILLWAIRAAKVDPDPTAGLSLRSIIRRISPLITPEDKLMLSKVMSEAAPAPGWKALAEELFTL